MRKNYRLRRIVALFGQRSAEDKFFLFGADSRLESVVPGMHVRMRRPGRNSCYGRKFCQVRVNAARHI